VARRYAEGESFYRVAKDYGCNYQAVKNACSRQGVEFRELPTAGKLSDGQIEEVVRLYKETDVSTNELAGRFGISAATVKGYLVRRGVPIRQHFARKEGHGHWRGGRHRDKKIRYARVRVQPDDWLYRHSTNGSMQEHRYVMAKKLGRPLESYETVHHIDGVNDDNRPENLELHVKRHGPISKRCTAVAALPKSGTFP
jgi:hypothetical protein